MSSNASGIRKKINEWVRNYQAIDPGGFNLVMAIQITLAGCLGALVWGVIKPPDPSLLFVQPALLIILLNMLSVQRRWFLLLFLTSLNIATGLFSCAVLYQCRFLFLLFILIYTYFNFVSRNYRPVGALVVILGTLNANAQGGWLHGVNNVINVFISLGLAMFTYALTSSLRRASVKRSLGQLALLLSNLYGETLANNHSVSDTNSASQCAALSLKLNVMINKVWYILPKEQILQCYTRRILHPIRILMMDHSLLHQLPELLAPLRKKVPATDELLADIAQRFQATVNGLSSPASYSPTRNRKLYAQWHTEKESFAPDQTIEQQSMYRLLYALECILKDLEKYENSIGHGCSSDTASVSSGIFQCTKLLFFPRAEPDHNSTVIDNFSNTQTQTQQRMIQSEYRKSAFRIAIAATASVFTWKAAQLPHGYWILMTTIIIYCGKNQGAFLQRSGYRLLGTLAGIVLTFLFVHDFLFFNITWAYTLPVVFFLTIYLYLLTGNYGIMSLFITLFTGLMLSTLSGIRPDFFLYGTLYYRLLCTMIAAVIVLVAELTIFPGVLQSATMLQRTWHTLIEDLAGSLHAVVSRYIRQSPFTTEEWHNLTGIIEKYASSGKLHHLMQYEIRVPDQYELMYKNHTAQMNQLLSAMGGLVAVAAHENPGSLSNDDIASINRIDDMLSRAITNLESYDPDNTRYSNHSLTEKIRERSTPKLQSLLFFQALEFLARQIQDLQQVATKRRSP